MMMVKPCFQRKSHNLSVIAVPEKRDEDFLASKRRGNFAEFRQFKKIKTRNSSNTEHRKKSNITFQSI